MGRLGRARHGQRQCSSMLGTCALTLQQYTHACSADSIQAAFRFFAQRGATAMVIPEASGACTCRSMSCNAEMHCCNGKGHTAVKGWPGTRSAPCFSFGVRSPVEPVCI